MQKFSFKFQTSTSVIIIVAGVLSAAMLVYNIFTLAQIKMAVNLTLQILFTIVNALLFAAILLILLCSKYKLVKNCIKVTMGFVPVASIEFSAIAKFVVSPATKEVFIIHKKGAEMKAHLLCLSEDDARAVMDAVNAVYPDILRETI